VVELISAGYLSAFDHILNTCMSYRSLVFIAFFLYCSHIAVTQWGGPGGIEA